MGLWVLLKAAYAGSIESIVSPLDDATNSLLIKSPTGWLHLTPFGAVRSTEGTVMVRFNGLCGIYVRLTRNSDLKMRWMIKDIYIGKLLSQLNVDISGRSDSAASSCIYKLPRSRENTPCWNYRRCWRRCGGFVILWASGVMPPILTLCCAFGH